MERRFFLFLFTNRVFEMYVHLVLVLVEVSMPAPFHFEASSDVLIRAYLAFFIM